MARYEALQFVKVDTASSGQTTLVSATAGKKVKVVGYALIAGGTVAVKLQSNSTDLTGAYPLVANGGIVDRGQQDGGHVLETAVGEALKLNLSAAVQVSGTVSYYLEST